MAARLVTTAQAAKALGIDRTTLARWANQGLVEPAYRTPGGQFRWDLDDLRRQLKVRPKDDD
jgi:excisionase family DNA binding protein